MGQRNMHCSRKQKVHSYFFYWIALVACLAVICSAFADAGNISIDGYVQPGEWAGASFSTLFGSEQESGCAVSYADVRTQADVSARRVYFALQVIDGAFAGEAGVHASISALEKRRLHWMPMETPKLLEFPMKCRRRANINRMVIMVIMCWRQQLSARRLYLRKI